MDDWDPEKEQEPEKLQKEFLEVGKEMLGRLKADEERQKKLEEEAAAMPPVAAYASYKPPTFQDVADRLKRAWEETKRIDPQAPAIVQVKMLEVLLQASWEENQAT